jgi:hypothetical protein
MVVNIDTSTMSLKWGTKGNNRVIQNIVNLLQTRKYEVAYDRTLGLSGDFIDKPSDDAIALATAEITDLIQQREPRATLIEVLHAGTDEDGNIQLEVVVDI